jgi:hypothetical protein
VGFVAICVILIMQTVAFIIVCFLGAWLLAYLDHRAKFVELFWDVPGLIFAMIIAGFFLLCVLGMADAALGHKEDAIREGRGAVELLPVRRDAVIGPKLVEYLALIYAWTGEKDLALEQLAVAARVPGYLSYGQLRLHPYWDPPRGDPRFEKIVASLAPKPADK